MRWCIVNNSSENLSAPKCQICQNSILDNLFACDKCGAMYHEQCWNKNEGCFEHGCENEGISSNAIQNEPLKTKQKNMPTAKGPMKKLVIISSLIVLVLAIGLYVFLQIVIPNNTYNKALQFYDFGNLDMAYMTIMKSPNSDKAKDLITNIFVKKASNHIKAGEYSDALNILNELPEGIDTSELRNEITYKTALEILESGDYTKSYELLTSISSYIDSKELAYQLLCEAHALKGIIEYQQIMYNPRSLRVEEILMYKNQNSIYSFPVVFVKQSGMNRVGGTITVYSMYTDKYVGSYNPSSSENDIISPIIKFALEQYENDEKIGDFDITRLNRLLKNEVIFNIEGLDFTTYQSDI